MKRTGWMLAVLAAAGLTLAGCDATTLPLGGGSTLGGTGTPPATGARFNVDTGQAFAGTKSVAIGAFKVSFVTEQKGTAKNRGSFLGGGGGMARASADAVLSGVSSETMQAITDAAYKQFVGKLQAAGYTVVPHAQVEANAAVKGTVSQPSPYKTNEPVPALSAQALVFAPSGQTLRFLPAQGAGMQGIGWSSPLGGFTKAAMEMGVPVIDVFYAVSFAAFDGASSRDTASVSVGQGIAVLQNSGVYLTKGEGGTFSTNQGSIKLSDAMGTPADFANIAKRDKSGADQAAGVLAAGVSVLLGGGTRSLETYDFKADPARYKSAVLGALGKASDAFAGEMTTLGGGR